MASDTYREIVWVIWDVPCRSGISTISGVDVIHQGIAQPHQLFRHQDYADVPVCQRTAQGIANLFLLVYHDAVDAGKAHPHTGVDIVTDYIKLHTTAAARLRPPPF